MGRVPGEVEFPVSVLACQSRQSTQGRVGTFGRAGQAQDHTANRESVSDQQDGPVRPLPSPVRGSRGTPAGRRGRGPAGLSRTSLRVHRVGPSRVRRRTSPRSGAHPGPVPGASSPQSPDRFRRPSPPSGGTARRTPRRERVPTWQSDDRPARRPSGRVRSTAGRGLCRRVTPTPGRRCPVAARV
jgi:hypothetical protein